MKISDTDAISTVFTWHQVKSSIARLPYLQYVVIDAPRRQNMEFYGPSDPFDRPMFLFITHRTLSGTPVRTFALLLYVFPHLASLHTVRRMHRHISIRMARQYRGRRGHPASPHAQPTRHRPPSANPSLRIISTEHRRARPSRARTRSISRASFQLVALTQQSSLYRLPIMSFNLFLLSRRYRVRAF